jgi:hypothetical protein
MLSAKGGACVKACAYKGTRSFGNDRPRCGRQSGGSLIFRPKYPNGRIPRLLEWQSADKWKSIINFIVRRGYGKRALRGDRNRLLSYQKII